MATLSISTILVLPLLFIFSLPIKANLPNSPPLSLLPSHNHPPLSLTKHTETSPTTNPNSPSLAADYFLPSPTTIKYQHMEGSAIVAVGGSHQAILAPFHICEKCNCCAKDDPKNCFIKPCCYGIVCNLPNKPPGECFYRPLSCDCNSCN